MQSDCVFNGVIKSGVNSVGSVKMYNFLKITHFSLHFKSGFCFTSLFSLSNSGIRVDTQARPVCPVNFSSNVYNIRSTRTSGRQVQYPVDKYSLIEKTKEKHRLKSFYRS